MPHSDSSPLRAPTSKPDESPPKASPSPLTSLTWRERVLDPRRQHALKIRREVLRNTRSFFEELGYVEVQTPLLVRSPGMEPHIKPFQVTSYSKADNPDLMPPSLPIFLPTSPEFSMKKLLVGGLQKIFQLSSCFRDEPCSPHHLPEFTMLEWYEAQLDLPGLQSLTEKYIHTLCRSIHNSSHLNYQGREIDLSPPWPRYRVSDLFWSHLQFDLSSNLSQSNELVALCQKYGIPAKTTEEWDDLYFKIWLNLIEPRLPKSTPCFVEGYPPSQAALATTSKDNKGVDWANRFEFYIGGIEIGNAFHELTDATVQKHRFEADMELRKRCYGESFPPTPIDEEFLSALEEGLPACSGIALGIDRVIQLLADEPDIRNTVWPPPYLGEC